MFLKINALPVYGWLAQPYTNCSPTLHRATRSDISVTRVCTEIFAHMQMVCKGWVSVNHRRTVGVGF